MATELRQFNGDTSTNYAWEVVAGSGVIAIAANGAGQTSIIVGRVGPVAASNYFAPGDIFFPYYATTTQEKAAIGSSFVGVSLESFIGRRADLDNTECGSQFHYCLGGISPKTLDSRFTEFNES
jgi:hypothetical protein